MLKSDLRRIIRETYLRETGMVLKDDIVNSLTLRIYEDILIKLGIDENLGL